jgi:osmoprotectant transport system ATP-binding protein
MGDRIALMKDGKLVQYDTPTNLLYRPKDTFVEGFVGVDRALKGLQLLRVKEVMSDTYITINMKDDTATIREKMEKEGIDWLPVVDENGRLAGGVSISDLTGIEVDMIKDIMSPLEITSDVNAVLNEALSLMLSSGLKALPIVDEDNRLAGVLTFDAIQETLYTAAKTGGSK